jgi:hypothetical protein
MRCAPLGFRVRPEGPSRCAFELKRGVFERVLCVLAVVPLLAAGCTDVGAPHQSRGAPRPADAAEGFATKQGAITCPPKLVRYPVSGVHNGGYDSSCKDNLCDFSCPPHPAAHPDNSDFGGDHFGNDIFAPKGAPVVAPVDGVVKLLSFVDSSAGGLYVGIEDSCGWMNYMAHLDLVGPDLFKGKQVKAGHFIGTVGNTGNAKGTSAHLHFSVYPPGKYAQGIDPFPLLKAVDASACGPNCKPACEGATAVDAQCKKTDCAAQGLACVQPAGVPTCGKACSPHCEGSVMVQADCSKGDCGLFGATCSASAGSVKCVAPTCTPSCQGNTAVAGNCAKTDCATQGGTCQLQGGVASCKVACTPGCSGTVATLANCAKVDCAAGGAACVMQNGAPTCAKPSCTPGCSGSVLTQASCSKLDCAASGSACVYVNGTAQCGKACTPTCSGTVAIGADCGKGDCGAFGLQCQMLSGKPTCVTPCTAHCEGNALVDAFCQQIACNTGAGGSGTCKYGSKGPTCVAGCKERCEGSKRIKADCSVEDCSKAFGATCINNGSGFQCGFNPPCVRKCDGNQVVNSNCSKSDCGAFGLTCKDYGLGPECELAICQPGCQGSKIIDQGCKVVGDCGAFGAVCSMTSGSPKCLLGICVPNPQTPPWEHDVCFDNKLFHCDAQGGAAEKSCGGKGCNACHTCGPAPAEVCNFVDDDCDGKVDEGVTNVCGGCGPVPAETCNGIDDDCDGQVDEGVTNACGQCGAVPAEVCNYVDDDCDGQVDEGATNACGQCGMLASESCDGADNDCDGQVDEDFADLGQPCKVGQGACLVVGVRVCAAGGGGTVCAAQPALGAAEVCNGIDDDCDGSTDEDFPELGAPCKVGVGACASIGVYTCSQQVPKLTCSASPKDCSDADPCTTDSCDPAKGCLHAAAPECCQQGGACGDGRLCIEGACRGVQCASCSVDADCGVGALCVGTTVGKRCAAACQNGACPQGFGCVVPDGGVAPGGVCVADDGGCDCPPQGAPVCVGQHVASADGCGTPLALLDDCGAAGCAAGACAGADTSPDAAGSSDGGTGSMDAASGASDGASGDADAVTLSPWDGWGPPGTPLGTPVVRRPSACVAAPSGSARGSWWGLMCAGAVLVLAVRRRRRSLGFANTHTLALPPYDR